MLVHILCGSMISSVLINEADYYLSSKKGIKQSHLRTATLYLNWAVVGMVSIGGIMNQL